MKYTETKIGFFSAFLNTDILEKSVSGYFSVFQTQYNFPDVLKGADHLSSVTEP